MLKLNRAFAGLTVLMLGAMVVPAASLDSYVQTNLTSDLPGVAAHQDPNLVNPWGIVASPTSPFWISDNHSGLSTLYNGTGAALPLVVTIPPPVGGSGPAAPTGIVFNSTPAFRERTSSSIPKTELSRHGARARRQYFRRLRPRARYTKD